MSAENTEQVTETAVEENVEKRHRVQCPRCGSNYLKRKSRRGFLHRAIYPIFGYYPWWCTGCKESVLIKKRGEPRKNQKRDSNAK